MSKTKIEWATKTWNPITGCNKVSIGCQNCYAERMAKRFAKSWGLPEDDPFKVTKTTKRHIFSRPLHWRDEQRVFAGSMTDFFHKDIPDWMRDEIFGVILACHVLTNPSHTFMILTKRDEEMLQYFTARKPVELLKAWAYATDWVTVGDGDMYFHEYVESAVSHDWDDNGRNSSGSEYKPWGYINGLWPLPNLYVGVTAENQEQAEKRIPILLQIPAAKRFVSIEPMLGPVDIYRYLMNTALVSSPMEPEEYDIVPQHDLHWVICGGESGPGARPMHPDWVRSLRDQCQAANVPFMFKQWGEWLPSTQAGATVEDWNKSQKRYQEGGSAADAFAPVVGKYIEYWGKVGKKKAGRLFDGELWDQYPEVTK